MLPSQLSHSAAGDLHLEDSDINPWRCFNDKDVTLTTFKEFTDSLRCSGHNSAYMLFYKKLSPVDASAGSYLLACVGCPPCPDTTPTR